MRTEAKHSLSGGVIHADEPKDHDGEGTDFSPTDLLVYFFRTCVITIMGIEAKRRGWKIGKIEITIKEMMNKSNKICAEIIGIFI